MRIEIDLVFVRAFLCGGSKVPCFSVGIENDLVFVRVVEIDFVFVCGPKMTWFQCMDRIDLIFEWGSKLN